MGVPVTEMLDVTVAVAVGCPGIVGVIGVLVGGSVAVGVTRLTGIWSDCPTCKALALSILFSSMMFCSMLLKRAAMPARVSPGRTRYSIKVPRERLAGIGVAEGRVLPGGGMRMVCPTKITPPNSLIIDGF